MKWCLLFTTAAIMFLTSCKSTQLSRQSQMTSIEGRELMQDIVAKVNENLVSNSTVHLGTDDYERGELENDHKLVKILIARQLLTGLVEVNQIASSEGIQHNQQNPKDMESRFALQMADYIKDIQTIGEAFKKGQSLVMPSYSTNKDKHIVEIQLTIRAVREAAKSVKLSNELTQEVLKPLISLL